MASRASQSPLTQPVNRRPLLTNLPRKPPPLKSAERGGGGALFLSINELRSLRKEEGHVHSFTPGHFILIWKCEAP